MKITKYLENLPEIVLANGEFCVTVKGDKQPYDPFLKHPVSAKDKFYSIFELLELNDIETYDTLGLKTGKGISMIDIDGCVSNGTIDEFATYVIDRFKTYTELSPSGTGIRLLFENADEFDFKKYKVKNSKIGLEFYDADDQEQRGARMCRLSGERINNYEFRKVHTQWLLDEYMQRSTREGALKEGLTSNEINYEWVEVVSFLLRHRTDSKALLNREIDIVGESEWDLMICNLIGEYTDNVNEIKEIFERTKYYKTKGIKSSKARHKIKWDGDYGWNTVNMSNPEIVRLSRTVRDLKHKSEIEDLISVAVEFELTKEFYFKGLWTKTDREVKNKEQLLFKLYELAGDFGVLVQKQNIKNKLLKELKK